MEVELVSFIGAGLAHACRNLSKKHRKSSIVGPIDGLALAQHLARTNDASFKTILEEATGKLCQTWRAIRVPDAVAIDHVKCLPAVFASCGSDEKCWHDLPPSPLDPLTAETLAGDIAALLVDEARTSGLLQRTGLLIPVSIALLEALFTVLLSKCEDVRALIADVDQYSSERPRPRHITPQGTFTSDLKDRLDDLARSAHDPELAHEIGLLAGTISEGQAAPTIRFLGELSARAEETDDTAKAARIWLYRFFLWSADYCAHVMDWPKADVYFALAARYGGSDGQASSPDVILHRARALTRAGDASGNAKFYADALQGYTRASAIVHEFESPLEWAKLHVATGAVLLKMCRLEPRSERFAAAALNLRPAISSLSQLEARDEWGHAQLLLANCLEGHGQIQGDPDLLADAIFSYRAALGVLSPDLDIEQWANAKAGLGRSILTLASETRHTPDLLEAISSLRAALGAQAHLEDRAKTEAALGLALLHYANETDDPVWLKDGIVVLGRVLQGAEAEFSGAARAKLKCALATALWTIGEREGDRTLLDEATAFLGEAREDYFAAGQVEAAQEISDQIAKYDDVLSAMRRPMRQRVRDEAPTSAKILQFIPG